jgi:hypothetical protein
MQGQKMAYINSVTRRGFEKFAQNIAKPLFGKN